MNSKRFYMPVAILLLLWNLLGVAAFVMQYGADLDALALTDPTTSRAFAMMPGWVWAIYAIAVGSGLAGAVTLLLRRSAASTLFLLSAIAVLVQFGYTFFGTDLLAVKGPASAAFPAFIIIVAIAQWLYARSLVAKGVLR